MIQNASRRIRIVVLSSAAYLTGFVLLYDAVGDAAMKLAVLPIIAMAWAFGRTGAGWLLPERATVEAVCEEVREPWCSAPPSAGYGTAPQKSEGRQGGQLEQ